MKPAHKRKSRSRPSPHSEDPAQAVQRAVPGIVNALIEQAQGGSYQHAKFLFEFAGIGSFPQAEAGGEESLAALLLRELQLEES